jgi:hypothetical protein
MKNGMSNRDDSPDTICFILYGWKFFIKYNEVMEVFEGKRKSWAFCDETQKCTMIISKNPSTGRIHLKPLIRQLKEYEIPFNELIFDKTHPYFQIPDPIEDSSQDIQQSTTKKSHFIIVDPEIPDQTYFQERKFLENGARERLTKKYGEGKTDDQLVFFQRQEEIDINKRIVLEEKLGINDIQHSRSVEELEDLLYHKIFFEKEFSKSAFEEIEKMNFEEYEDLFIFYRKLSNISTNTEWIIYKLDRLIIRREEYQRKYGSYKKLEELDELLKNNELF